MLNNPVSELVLKFRLLTKLGPRLWPEIKARLIFYLLSNLKTTIKFFFILFLLIIMIRIIFDLLTDIPHIFLLVSTLL